MSYRPAGFSSDEEYSDDDYEGSMFKPKKNYYQNKNHFEDQSSFKTPEEELFDAVKHNCLSKVKELVSKGVNLNALQGDWTPFMYSCLYGHVDVMKLLLEKGSNINFNKDFFTPLMAVCSNSILSSTEQKAECAKLLLDHGVDINATDRFCRSSAFMLAAREGLLEVVKLLVERNCEINKQDKDGWNGLCHAVNSNQIEVVDFLIASGANLKLKDIQGRSAYDLAVIKGFTALELKLKPSQEVIETEPLFNIPAILTIKQMINELPSRNVGINPGFPSDIYQILLGLDLQTVAEPLYKNNVQLGEFLVMNDNQLKENGIRFSAHRKKILESLKRFHMYRWQKSSIVTKPRDDAIEIIDGVKLTANTARQLLVLQSSLHYIQLSRIESDIQKKVQKKLEETLESALNITELVEKELIVVRNYAQRTDRLKKVRTVDLISKEEENFKIVKSAFTITIRCVAVFLCGLYFFRARKFVKTTHYSH